MQRMWVVADGTRLPGPALPLLTCIPPACMQALPMSLNSLSSGFLLVRCRAAWACSGLPATPTCQL